MSERYTWDRPMHEPANYYDNGSWLGDKAVCDRLNEQNAEITRLRAELAQRDESLRVIYETAQVQLTALQECKPVIAAAIVERDTLRQQLAEAQAQLAVAREGLEYVKKGMVPAIVQHLDDTLAKMEEKS